MKKAKKGKVGQGRSRIGDIIKEAREKLEMSADDVAEACNVCRSRVYSWEADNYVYHKNFDALSATLHIPVGRLRRTNGRRPRV